MLKGKDTENIRYRGSKQDRNRWKSCASLLGIPFVDFTREAMEAYYHAKCVDLVKSTGVPAQKRGK